MDLPTFFQTFWDNVCNTTLLEAIAATTGLISIWYNKKVNILVYPIGIVSVLIYVYICYNAKLYADMGINAVYFIMNVYGWYNWSRPRTDRHSKLKVSFQSTKARWIGILVSIILFIALSFLLSRYTDSDVPYIDAFTTALCLLGMYLTTQKNVENWVYYFIADLISVPLYIYKGLVFTSFQYFVFLIIAAMAYHSWRKEALQNA